MSTAETTEDHAALGGAALARDRARANIFNIFLFALNLFGGDER